MDWENIQLASLWPVRVDKGFLYKKKWIHYQSFRLIFVFVKKIVQKLTLGRLWTVWYFSKQEGSSLMHKNKLQVVHLNFVCILLPFSLQKWQSEYFDFPCLRLTLGKWWPVFLSNGFVVSLPLVLGSGGKVSNICWIIEWMNCLYVSKVVGWKIRHIIKEL